MFTKKSLASAIMLVTTLSLIGCGESKEASTEQPAQAAIEIVRPALIETVTSEAAAFDFAYVGTVQAAQRADLSFELSGKIISMLVEEGDYVQKGQVVAELDKKTLNNNYQSSLAEYRKAEKDTERLEAIYEANRAISLSDLENSRTQKDILKARLENQRQQLEHATLRAPFPGVISRKATEEFSFVQAKETIFGLQNLEELEVEVYIPGSVVLTNPETARTLVVFDQLPDLKLPAEFKYIATEGDAKTQTYKVVLSLPKTTKANILPGMSVTVIPDESMFDTSKDADVMVPLRAVVSDNAGRKYIWKVREDGSVYQVFVETGALLGDRVTVLSGLMTGDRVVTAGVSSLKDGMKVRPLDQE
ncbi:efflux RND transporter periplasmic adaptor subunit [Endozoicomonas sp. OPT23]|uniref:efflux RND transporter periplasmic adaptor subunit n=1 Tax=Endozoicomonas sp. OPT23 TaxID=2072845 RepID=UPI00129B70A5|nr:efflux RND transporter periplasmic adaptor subunit [Endozoicomonas sp. OPT23]